MGPMSLLSRSIPMVAFALALSAQDARAQEVTRSDDFRWYVGGQAGAFVLRTPNQTRGAIPMAGGHMMIKARRGAVYLAVEEAFGDEQQSSYTDYSAGGGSQAVTFTDVRRYTFGLMAFPVYGHMQPYFGVGAGIMHVVSPQPLSGGSSALATEVGSGGFGAFIAGLQFRVGGMSAFGQYQIQTVPAYQHVLSNDGEILYAEGRLISGAVHTFTGGLRISLGRSREEL
jgi:hypothetical protein